MSTNRFYDIAKLSLLTGVSGIKLDGDIRLLLAMTNTTLDTENVGVEVLSDFTTLDEFDGAGYARLALSTATPAVAISESRNSVQLTCTDHPVFATLSAGTRSVAGVLFYWNILADDDQSVPFLYCGYATPRVPDGTDFTIELPADKLIMEFFQVAAGTSPVDIDA